MATLAEFRAQYPQYDDVPDVALADSLHEKFYSKMPKMDLHGGTIFLALEKCLLLSESVIVGSGLPFCLVWSVYSTIIMAKVKIRPLF